MNFIPLISPNISEQDIESVVDVLRSGMLVQGEQVAALESEFADYLQVKNAIAVSNGTATLHLALVAHGIGAGDEVIVPAFSYAATANVVEIVGAKCVFVDTEKDTFNIDVEQIESAITSRTKAIIPVHEFGVACDISALMQIAEKHNLLVIEDAACALGATENGKFVGSFGQVGSFSLHPRKAVTSGEGGILTTDDDELAEKFRILRNHGIKMNNGKMDFVEAGFNYRMTDFQAALVRGQFANIEKIIKYRNELAEIYLDELKDVKNIQLPVIPEGKRHTWQTFHIIVGENINRDDLIAELKTQGIGTNYGAQCIPFQTFYREKYDLDCEREFPNALRAFQKGLALPIYEKLQTEDIKKVSDNLLNSISPNDYVY
ncbi:MAG: DegT/DnrJ/EryC1/StrS family aminotransferase [Aridibacter sp.]